MVFEGLLENDNVAKILELDVIVKRKNKIGWIAKILEALFLIFISSEILEWTQKTALRKAAFHKDPAETFKEVVWPDPPQ